MLTTGAGIDRDEALEWYQRNRARTAALFDVVVPEAYYEQPIALRHPLVFYDGHLPAFSLNTLVKRGLGQPGVDARLEQLFARGIDPEVDAEAGASGAGPTWPDRAAVRRFVAEADRLVMDALAHADLDQPGRPLMEGAEAVHTILEHEAMHQETLLYMWHRLPHAMKRAPADYRVVTEGPGLRAEEIIVPEGPVRLGAEPGAIPFGWDNEFPGFAVQVPEFGIDRYKVSNADFLAFVEAGGYDDPQWWTATDWEWLRASGTTHPPFWRRVDGTWHWFGMFELLPLPERWPAYVSHAEARAYARWRGRRLATEAEIQRAMYGAPDGSTRRHPWGDAAPTADHGVFDFTSWEPQPLGTHPAGRSAWGLDDVVGNGWEWTSTIFEGYPGFAPLASYPEYSADFFDGQHFVMKGASPATARELLRPSFRNWFRAHYPYVYAGFRTVRSAS
ncbi:MAG: SUMF1/EgtB/PvdO family nonheme iron enzyme [Vicinamibacterales bacterium]